MAGGEADSDEVRTAGEALHDLGLRWEATRLVGSAALRIEDDGAKELLAAAREMRASIPGQETEATPLPARLSERELEVAEQLITGITYKEIGSRLFISPKTVEHHVARMRQRLGATSRSELMQMLRAELGG